MIIYAVAFALVAFAVNMANRNIAKRRNPRIKKKTRKQILKDWEEFKKEHPGSSSKL